MEFSVDDNSLSSPTPLSPPQNNKRIDSYFTPKEGTRSDSRHFVARNLFGAKSSGLLPQQQTDASSLSLPDIPHNDLSTPSHSLDALQLPSGKPPIVPLDSATEGMDVPTTTSQTSFDLRSKDMHSLLMIRDQRIKDLEHVELPSLIYLRNFHK